MSTPMKRLPSATPNSSAKRYSARISVSLASDSLELIRRGIFIGPDRSGSGHTVATEGGMVDHVHPDETGLKRAEMATDPFQSLRIRPSGTLIPNTTWNAVIRYPAKFVFFQYPPPLELIHPTTNAPPRLRQTIQMRFTETRLSHKTFFRLMLLILPSSMRVATP